MANNNVALLALLKVVLLSSLLYPVDAAQSPAAAEPPPNAPGSGPATCSDMFGAEPVPFLFVADPGGFTGSAEAKYLFENLKAVTTIYTFSAHCAGMYVGNLLSQRIVLTTTGIGPMQAAACVQAILAKCAKNMKMAVYMGTSGFPAAIGGILNPPDCSAPSPKRGKGQVTRIGDLCITPFAINWDCKLADWTQQATGYPNLCFRPTEHAGPEVSSLYGKCLFYGASPQSLALSGALAAAARSTAAQNTYPATLAGTVAYTDAYWNHTIAGTGVDYYRYAATDPVNVWDYTQCVEVDSQFFFSGVPWEIATRDYAALTLNLAFNTTTYNATNVVYSNAMEGIGLAFALEAHNDGLAADKKLPYSIIRGNADYTHMPVKNLGNGNWTYEFELPGDFVNNYKTAIISYSVAIMTYFKNLCLAQGLADCTFVVSG